VLSSAATAWVGYQSDSRSKGSTTDLEFGPSIDYFLVDAISIGADAFFRLLERHGARFKRH